MRTPKQPRLKYDQIDRRCRDDIMNRARGQDTAWPGDKYERGSCEERFERGDLQAMLWAIVLDHADDQPAPVWAIDALRRALIEMAVGATWMDVFGRETAERGNNAGANRESIRLRARYMYRVYDFVEQRRSGRNLGKLYAAIEASRDFPFGKTLAQRYHKRMLRYYK